MKKAIALLLSLAGLVMLGISLAQSTSSRETVDLRTGPIINSSDVSNLALVLSVEFPTVGAAYRTTTYNQATKYLGYFNPNMCYTYIGGTQDGYYAPNGPTYVRSGPTDPLPEYLCNRSNGGTGFSGNYLNFVATSSIDIVRFALSGGDRVVDSSGAGTDVTISIASPGVVTLANHGFIEGTTVQLTTTGTLPGGLNKCGIYFVTAPTTNTFQLAYAPKGTTVATPWGTPIVTTGTQTGTHKLGNRGVSECAETILQRAVLPGGIGPNGSFYGSGSNWPTKTLPTTSTLTSSLTPWANGTLVVSKSCYDNLFFGNTDTGDCTSPGNNANLSRTGAVVANAGVYKARVQVCSSIEASSRSDLCKQYPSGEFKPIGEIQKNADKVRVAAFGYLLEQVNTSYGGVLRAPMKFAGTVAKDANGIVSANSTAEWNSDTGVFVAKPIDTANESGFVYSGVINYLNTFGRNQGIYKRFDPMGEFYYETIRYFQGKQPSTQATAGITTANRDALLNGYPIYTNWSDPMQSSCQRNYALAIGDNNTHLDAEIPGSAISGQTRAVDGTGVGALNAAAWTSVIESFETNGTVTYVDSQGVTRTANGNATSGATGVQTGNTALPTKATGADRASFLWAGVAYWANTQPIRADKPLARVRSFIIDVDEGGNGTLQRGRSYYLAGKYGGFADVGPDQSYATGEGNPFRTYVSGTLTSSTAEWLSNDGSTSPSGYFLASQPQRMIDAIKKIFAQASKPSGNLAGGSLSVSRLSAAKQSGAFYQAQINPTDWSGTLIRTEIKFNTTTNALETNPTPIWDAANILTGIQSGTTTLNPIPLPANRKIVSYSSTTRTGVNFVWDDIDATVKTSLNTDPSTQLTDSRGQARLNYLRGVRTDEQLTSEEDESLTFRARQVIMGDSINSAPVLKGAPGGDITDASYRSFYSTNAGRTPTVYVGTNDGMLRAFVAAESQSVSTNGRELFAYVPRAVSLKLNQLTDPAYVKQAYVDGGLSVNEARIYKGAGSIDWGTVLVSGMGGGAKGLFALDVTSPETFDASKVLWEFTSENDSDMGNLVAEPKVVKLAMSGNSNATPNYKWFAMVTSGYNNYTSGGANDKQALFLLSLEKAPGDAWVLGTNYYKMYADNSGFTSSSNAATGMGMPAPALGPQGNTLYAYAGDLQGNLWKFDLTGASTTWSDTANAKVLFRAKSAAGVGQPITVTPGITLNVLGGYQICFGTGKFLEPKDGLSSSAAQQSLYGIWDAGDGKTFERRPITSTSVNGLITRTAVIGTDTQSLTGSAFTYGTDSSKYRGWFADFVTTLERVAVDPVIDTGLTAINTTIPAGDPCSSTGGTNPFRFNCATGLTFTSVSKSSVKGYLGTPSLLEVGDTNYSPRSDAGRYLVTRKINSLSPGVGGGISVTESTVTTIAGRINWREITNFQ